MKIGFVTGEFPPMEGGVGAFTQALTQALAIDGHEIHIITTQSIRPQGQRRVRDLMEPVKLDFAYLHPRIRRWRWPSLTTIVDLSLRYEFDLVNIQYQAAAYDMRSPAIHFLPWRLMGVTKTAVTFHDLRVPYLFPKAGRLRRAAVNFMARHAHGVIVTNAEDYQSLLPSLQSPISQIPIGSNITPRPVLPEEVTAVREELGLPRAGCLLGYFGFLHQSKGGDTLLRALAKLDESTHLLFIGGQTGSSDTTNTQAFQARLNEMIDELKLTGRVHWTGFVSADGVSAYLQAADLMVMPYRDGVSLRRGSLMAVLAHGRPFITTQATTPAPQLVHGQNVWLTPPDDVGALTEGIQTLLANSELRAALSRGAAELAGRFTWDKIAQQTAAFFAQLITPQKRY
jgi:glycosyltransferase involved in cell wall biosynthesis